MLFIIFSSLFFDKNRDSYTWVEKMNGKKDWQMNDYERDRIEIKKEKRIKLIKMKLR